MSSINFQASIQFGISRDRLQRFVRVEKPHPNAQYTVQLRVRNMEATVFTPQVGETLWDEAAAAELQSALRAKLDELIDNSELINLPEDFGNKNYVGVVGGIANRLMSFASSYLEQNVFEDSVDDIQVVAQKSEAVLGKVSAAVNPDPVDTDVTDDEPEVPDYEEGQTQYQLVAPLSARFLQPNNALFVGTGIPGTKYNIVSNDLLEIGMTAHRRSKWDEGRTFDEADIQLDLATTDPADRWVSSWSIGLKNDEVALITDLFDVEFIIGLRNDGTLNEGEVVYYTLGYDSANAAPASPYVFTEQSGVTNSIIDSRGDVNNRCVQNSSSHHWFKAALLPAIGAADAVEGTYTFLIRATNKQTGNVLENFLTVSAMV